MRFVVVDITGYTAAQLQGFLNRANNNGFSLAALNSPFLVLVRHDQDTKSRPND